MKSNLKVFFYAVMIAFLCIFPYSAAAAEENGNCYIIVQYFSEDFSDSPIFFSRINEKDHVYISVNDISGEEIEAEVVEKSAPKFLLILKHTFDRGVTKKHTIARRNKLIRDVSMVRGQLKYMRVRKVDDKVAPTFLRCIVKIIYATPYEPDIESSLL